MKKEIRTAIEVLGDFLEFKSTQRGMQVNKTVMPLDITTAMERYAEQFIEDKNPMYVVHYTYEGAKDFEGVTNNPDLWLRKHNAQRVADGNMPESKDEFEFTETQYEELTEENTPEYSLFMCEGCRELVPSVKFDSERDGDFFPCCPA